MFTGKPQRRSIWILVLASAAHHGHVHAQVAVAEPPQGPIAVPRELWPHVQEAIADGELSGDEVAALRKAGVTDTTLDRLREAYDPGRKPSHYMALPLRRPVCSRELELLVDYLGLSDAQEQFARTTFESYRERWDKTYGASDPLFRRSGRLAEEQRVYWDPGAASEFADLLDESRLLSLELAGVDRWFLETISASLAEEQVEGLPRVRHLRDRRCFAWWPDRMPGADIDMSWLCHELGLDLASGGLGAVQTALIEYESRLAQLLRERPETIVTARATRAKLMASVPWDEVDEAEAQAAARRLRALNHQVVELGRRTYQLNLEFLADARSMLSPAEADRLRDAFRAKAYPAVYPYDSSVLSFMHTVLAQGELPPEVRQHIERLLADTEQAATRADEQMVGHYVDWRERLSEAGGYDPRDYPAYEARMQALLEARCQAFLHATDVLLGVLPAQQDRILAIREALQGVRERCTGPASGWPGPTDLRVSLLREAPPAEGNFTDTR